MLDTERLKVLSKRLQEITSTLTECKRTLDATGERILPYDIYQKLVEERRDIRAEMWQITEADNTEENR